MVASQQQDPGMAELRAEFSKGLADLWLGMRQLQDQLASSQEGDMQMDAA